jgi:hypothetical protein
MCLHFEELTESWLSLVKDRRDLAAAKIESCLGRQAAGCRIDVGWRDGGLDYAPAA